MSSEQRPSFFSRVNKFIAPTVASVAIACGGERTNPSPSPVPPDVTSGKILTPGGPFRYATTFEVLKDGQFDGKADILALSSSVQERRLERREGIFLEIVKCTPLTPEGEVINICDQLPKRGILMEHGYTKLIDCKDTQPNLPNNSSIPCPPIPIRQP